MRIFQILPTITMGDGVSQNALDIESVLNKNGHQCVTYAKSIIGTALKKRVVPFDRIPRTEEDDIIIYHLSTGSEMVEYLLETRSKLVICYHNITPSHFFGRYDKHMEIVCEKGRRDLMRLAKRADLCLADSTYNVNELKAAGYECECMVVPIAMDFSRFGDTFLKRTEETGRKHILFTGRIVPNKKIEELLEVFAEIQKEKPEEYVLDIVGKYSKDSTYYKRLRKYEKMLGVNDVIFHGHVTNEQLVQSYRKADVYLSLSEHEGFCIPLLEAMYFEVPVIAYDAGAVSETMGDAGILLKEKNVKDILLAIDLCERREARHRIIAGQKEHLKKYELASYEKMLLEILEKI